MGETTFRLRVVYGKTGRLRFLSHLEVVRGCERAVRRAGLEYAVTQGFTPRMKVAFGPALPVGTAGPAESYDLWLRRYVPVARVLELLAGASPRGLMPVGASYVPESEPSLTAALTIATYEVLLEGPDMGSGRLAEALDAVMAPGSLEIEHKGKTRVYDLAECLVGDVVADEERGRAVVSVTVRMGAHGSLRPDVLISEALDRSHLEGAIVSVTRTGLRPEQGTA